MEYKIDEKYRIKSNHGSKGYQIKYYRNGYWYKLDSMHGESKYEHLVSIILKHSNIDSYVNYTECIVNGRKACRSKTFLAYNEEFITIARVIEAVYGVSNAENFIWSISDIEVRFNTIVNSVLIYTNNQLNIANSLRKLLYLDLFILNTDRHLNNIGIISNEYTNKYRIAPVFDNGICLLSGQHENIVENGITDTINTQCSRTISGSFLNQALASTNGELNSPLKIDFKAIKSELKQLNIRNETLQVISYQYKQLGRLYL